MRARFGGCLAMRSLIRKKFRKRYEVFNKWSKRLTKNNENGCGCGPVDHPSVCSPPSLLCLECHVFDESWPKISIRLSSCVYGCGPNDRRLSYNQLICRSRNTGALILTLYLFSKILLQN